MHRSSNIVAVAACVAVAWALVALSPARGASNSSSLVVTLGIASETHVATTACSSGTPGVTAFGVVQPGSKFVANPCVVSFGSTNDSAMLTLSQQDALGGAMYRMTDGTLDAPYFDTDGILTRDIGGGADQAGAVVRQPDGRLIVAGQGTVAGNTQVLAMRLLPDGSLDPTWDPVGLDGIVAYPVGAGFDAAEAAVLQPDGKLVLVGYWWTGTEYDAFAMRLLANGALDTSFDPADRDGVVTFAAGLSTDVAEAVALQPDGKIVVAGYAGNGADEDMFAVRLRADGSFGPTFDTVGTDGKVLVGYGGGLPGDQAWGVEVLPSGKILLSGTATVGGTEDFAAARLNADGSLDTTFDPVGLDGKVSAPIQAGSDRGIGLAVLASGKFVVTGRTSNGSNNDVGVVKFNANGSLDTTFDPVGLDGKVTVNFGGAGGDVAYDAFEQADGKLVLFGYASTGAGQDAFIGRLNADGSPDPTFDPVQRDGYLVTSLSPGNDAYHGAVEVADGGIVGAGWSSGAGDVALAQFQGFPVADYAGGANWSAGTNTFGACLASLTGTGAAAAWPTTGSCPSTDGTNWRPVLATALPGAKVATAAAANDAVATLRFGLRPATTQVAGSYLAPVVFATVAPAV